VTEDIGGKQAAEEAAVRLQETLSLLEAAEGPAARFRGYVHDNHWADKAERVFWARNK
jgi:hypothetical protein